MKIEIDIPEANIASAISSAVDSGGITYWSSEVCFGGPKGKVSGWASERDECLFRPLQKGLLKIYDNDSHLNIVLKKKDFIKGIKLMAVNYPGQFAALLESSTDRLTGDILIQLACFGEIKYG